jgi:acetolactate synthase-1/2/3 large subunit
VLQALNKIVGQRNHLDWIHRIEQWRIEHPALEVRDCEELIPQYVIRQIYNITKGEAIMVTGVGQNQMWAAQYYFYNKPNSFVSSGGLGTMGFEIPGAIGAKVGRPEETVWCIAGDGGFQMTIQELATITQEKIDVKIAIINNGHLGMVRQWQELFYQKNFVGVRIAGPDYVKIAEGYGIPGMRVDKKIDVIPAIEKAMAYNGAFLLDFIVEPDENVFPIVPPGAALAECLELPKKHVVTPSAKPR